MDRIYVDSFSTSIADLPRGKRTKESALECLIRCPRVRTFDMSEHYTWLPDLVKQLENEGLIVSVGGEYPWHKYEILTT